jgi:hypothetical protein
MTVLTIKAMCGCGFAKEWKFTALSRPETDHEFSLWKEAMKWRAEPHGPHH